MYAIEKATEQVMCGVQLTYNVQILEEGFLHEVSKKQTKARLPNMLCKTSKGGFSKV